MTKVLSVEPESREWLSPAEAAALLGVSLSTVRLMVADGRLPARKIRGSHLLRISRHDVLGLVEGNDLEA